MTIKEREIKNSKIHAFVNINPFLGIVEACIPKELWDMHLYLLLCCFPRVTQLKSLSLSDTTYTQTNGFTNLFIKL